MSLIVFPDVEALLVRTLEPLLGVPVSTKVPSPRPDAFLTVSRVGGTSPNLITDSPLVVFECWGETQTDASDLGRRVRAYVFALAQTDNDGEWVRRVVEVGGLQSFPDPVSGAPRYQFTVQIDTRGVPL